jgi:hypothetical protein
MPVRSISFDDESSEELNVFSGTDLVISHYDVADLDWSEVTERTLIDERRGLVIAQVVVLEDFLDEFILYLADPADITEYQRQLDRQTIGPRIMLFERLLRDAEILDQPATELITDLRAVVARRNTLAHGTLHCRPLRIVPIKELSGADVELEWILTNRRSRQSERVSMARLRKDVHDAIATFAGMLDYAEFFLEIAPSPQHFRGGSYLGIPTD